MRAGQTLILVATIGFASISFAKDGGRKPNQARGPVEYRLTDSKTCNQMFGQLASSDETKMFHSNDGTGPDGLYEVRHFNSSAVCYGLKPDKRFFQNWFPVTCFCDLTLQPE